MVSFITQPEAWAKKEEQKVVTSEKLKPSSGQTVVFSGSDITVQWGENDNSLLELAEQNGLTTEHSCSARPLE